MANNSINFNIGFKVNDSGLKQARTALDQFLNNGVNAKQLSLINQQDLNTSLKMIGDATKEVGKFEAAMTQAYNVKLGTVNLERFNEELEKNGTSLQNFKEKMTQLGPTGQQTYAQMASGLMNVKYETVETTTLLDKLGDSLRRALLTFTSINIINKVKGSIGEAYGYVKNLDSSLNDIRIVTGKSADEMDRFAEKANKAAASLGKATTDYTKASTIFYQQGLGNEDVEARTEVALKVANTTGADTSKAADQLTAIWNGFNVGAEDAEKSIDVVAAVAANTASNLDEMATAMSKVASMANSMGVSEEQLAAQISTVIAVTRQAPESVGTAFKTIYARISDIKAGSEDAEISLGNYSGKLAALGINVLDAAGNLKDMGQVIEEVGANWDNYSKEQQVAIAGLMGGQKQVNQIRALFDNWDKYTETMKVAAEAEGTLQQQQDTYMESAEGQLQKLRTEWEGVLDSLLKAEDIIKVAKNISPLIQGLEKVVDALGGGVGILQKFSPLLISLVSPQISQGIGKMVNSFQAAQTNMKLAQQQAEVWNMTMKDTQFTDKYAKSIQSLGADYISLMNGMSAEQKNDFQASMQRFVDVTAGEVSQKLSELNIQYEQLVQQGGIDIVPVSEMDDVDAIQKKLEKLKDITLNFPEISFVSKKGKILSGGSSGLSNSIEQAKKEYKELEKIFGADLPPAVERFKKALENVEIKRSRQNVEALKQAYEDLTKDGLRGSTEELEKYKEKIKEYIKSLQEAEQQQGKIESQVRQLKTEQIVRNITSIAQGVTSLVAAYKQFKNLGSVWKDEDLTASEKMSQTLMTIGSVVAITIPSILSLAKAYKELTKAETEKTFIDGVSLALEKAHAVLTGELTLGIKRKTKSELEEQAISLVKAKLKKEEIILALQQAGATEAEAVAALNAAEANVALNLSIKGLMTNFVAFIPIALALAAAIGAVVAAIAYWKNKTSTKSEAMEKEREKQQKVIEGYEKMKEGIEEYQKSTEELHKLTKGTEEYNKALDEQNKKIQDLIEKYPQLKKAMHYEGNEMVLDEDTVKGIEEEEDINNDVAKIKILEAGLTKDRNNRINYENELQTDDAADLLFQQAQGFAGTMLWSDEERQDYLSGGLEKNRVTLTEIAKLYNAYGDITSETMSSVIKKYQDMGFTADEINEKIKNNVSEITAQAKLIEERNQEFQKTTGINFSAFENGDFSSVSSNEIKQMEKLLSEDSFKTLKNMGFTDEDIEVLKGQLNKAKDVFSNFKNELNEDLDLGILQNFEGKLIGLGDNIKEGLGEGLVEIQKNLNWDDSKLEAFSKLLANMGTEEGLSKLNKWLEENNIEWEQLPEGINNYKNALNKLNSTTNVSIGSISDLMGVMSKLSSVKMGDTFSAKDFEEIQSALEKSGISWENYFTKVGDKFKYIRTDIKDLSKLMDKVFIQKMTEAKKDFEGLANVNQMATSDIIGNLGDNVLNTIEGWTAEGARDLDKKIKNRTATEEEIKAYDSLIEKIRKAAENAKLFEEENRKALADEYIGSYIHTLGELEKKIDGVAITEEDAQRHRAIILKEELANLDITEEAYEHYADTIKKITGNENLKDFQIVAKLKLDINGEELIKQVTDTLEDLPNKTEGQLAVAASKISEIFSNNFGINLSADFFMKDNNLKLVEQTFNGSDEASEKLFNNIYEEEKKKKKLIEEAYKSGNIALAVSLQNELNGLNEFWDILLEKIETSTEKTIKKLQQELKKTNLEQQKTLLETQKSLTENRRGKVENRMAHASGSEYLTLSKSQKGYREQEFSLLQQTQNLDLQILQCEKEIAEQEALALGLSKEQLGMTYEQVQASDLEADKKRAILAIRGYDVELQARELTNAQELEDFYEKQYVTIDKLASTNAQRTKSERELAKLQREEKGLSGKELLENRKKQREIEQQILEDKKEALKIQKETVEDTKSALTEALLDINVELDYDENAGILNRTEILEALNGKYDEATIEAITHLMDELDDNTDQLYDLQEEIADAEQVIAAASDTDENTKIKSNNDRIAQLQNEQKKFAEGSSEWYAIEKKINDIEADNAEQLVSKVKDRAKKDFGIAIKKDNYNLGTYDEYINDYLVKTLGGEEDENSLWSRIKKNGAGIKTDEFGRITNIEELAGLGLLTESDKELLDGINAGVATYMDEVNAAADAQSNFIAKNPYQEVELSVKKAEKAEQDLQKTQQNLTAEVQKTNTAMSQLQSDASFLYGDDLVANLEAQIRCLEEQQQLVKEQVELDKESERIAQEKLEAAQDKLDIDKENYEKEKENLGKTLNEKYNINIDNYIDTKTGELNKNALSELGVREEDIKLYEDFLEKRNTSEKEYNAALKESQDAQNKTLQDLAAENKLTNDILNKRREIAQAKLKTAEDAIKRETNADHKLSKALLDVDEAINKVKRSQNGLTGPALISAMQQEVALQQQKKVILEQQKAQIDAQIQSLIKLYSLHLSTEYGIRVGFNVDETGVTNVDALYKSIENLDEKVKGAAMQDIQNFISTLNGLAGNALSAKKSVNSLGDSIEDLNKKIEDTQKAELFRVKEERWSNIDQELKKIARELSRVEKLQKNLTGDALIKNLEHQQQLLEKQAEAQKNKLAIMKAELQTMQTMLGLQGVLFTSDGLIANYAAVMAKGDEKLNGYMQSYQQFYDQISDLEDSILDTYDKKADLEAEKMAERLRMFNTKIDIELDLTKAKREWQNFKREFLNTLNDMSQLNDSIAEKCKQNVKDIKDMTTKDTVMLTDHVNDIIQEIKIMQAGGTSDLYGVDQTTALSDLANYRQQLQDTLSSLADKIKETEEAFLQQLEKIKSKFDDQIGNYETIQSIIEHDMNLIKLLRGDDAYDELANYYDKSTKNYEAELQTLRQQVDYWKNLMDSAQPGTEEWEKFQSNWKDALNKLNSAVDAAVQNLIDKYKNAINKIMADFEKKITNGSSLDTAKQRWDWQKQQADFFLDTITKEYEIEKLRMKINKAAEDESDPAKRARILQIGDKQLKQLQSLTKVRQYDVDLANKQLELELKKQELEDAKNQKTSMRLRRDAEGNYRYEYVADQDKINELKESILDAEQDIYEFTVKNQRDLQDQMYENVKAFEDAIRDLVSRRSQMTEDEYNAELQRIKDHFGFMDDAIRGALDKAAADVTDAATTEAIDLGLLYQEQLDKMSELQKRKFAEDIVPTFISAITEMKDIIDGEGGLINAAKFAFDELDNAFNELQNELNDIQAAAGVDFDTIIAGIDDTINEMQALIEDNDELLVQYQEELDVIRDLIDELHDLMDAYRDVYDAAMNAIDVALELRETAREAMEEYNDLNSMANDTGGATGGTSTSTGNGKVPTGNYAAKKNTQYLNSSGLATYKQTYYHAGIDENGNTKIFSSADSSTFASVKPGQTYVSKDGTKYQMYGNENSTDYDVALREAQILKDDKQRDAHMAGHFDTGGYTGAWGNEGKIAILHEKELVLNQDDTKNILRAVAQVRANAQIGLSSNDFNILSNMMAGIHNIISDIYSALVNNQADTLTQQAAAVSNYSAMNNSNITNNINANFPNAGNMNEIKSAIMGLSNYASQKIHSNQRLKNTSTPNAYRTNSF